MRKDVNSDGVAALMPEAATDIPLLDPTSRRLCAPRPSRRPATWHGIRLSLRRNPDPDSSSCRASAAAGNATHHASTWDTIMNDREIPHPAGRSTTQRRDKPVQSPRGPAVAEPPVGLQGGEQKSGKGAEDAQRRWSGCILSCRAAIVGGQAFAARPIFLPLSHSSSCPTSLSSPVPPQTPQEAREHRQDVHDAAGARQDHHP